VGPQYIRVVSLEMHIESHMLFVVAAYNDETEKNSTQSWFPFGKNIKTFSTIILQIYVIVQYTGGNTNLLKLLEAF